MWLLAGVMTLNCVILLVANYVELKQTKRKWNRHN